MNTITNEQVEAAYEARHQAFATNAANRYALADRALALALSFDAQKQELAKAAAAQPAKQMAHTHTGESS